MEMDALFPLFSQSNVDQIGYPRTVLESACPKDLMYSLHAQFDEALA